MVKFTERVMNMANNVSDLSLTHSMFSIPFVHNFRRIRVVRVQGIE